MPGPDTAVSVAPPQPATSAPIHTKITGWGGGRGTSALLHRPTDAEGVRAALSAYRHDGTPARADRGAIPRGMARSYGDAAQLANGLVLEMTGLKGFSLQAEDGTVVAQAGTTLGELLAALVPAGWMVPVVPGTQHVTVGGAIASDIHGKNHGTAGTFGQYVRALGLLTAAGEVLELAPGMEDGIFEATVGGLGLTGVILWAEIQLRPVSSALLRVDTDRVETLEQALSALSAAGGPHRVAWLDLLSARPGRGIVTRAEHLEAGATAARGEATVRGRATVPRRWPSGVLRTSAIRAFNELRYRSAPRSERGRPEGLGVHMFPLDALDAWPRLYGRGGLLQYQLVVPPGAETVLETVIERLRRTGVPCFLAVLKDFGPANDFPLSFPIAGWTLALDFPRCAPGLEPLLTEFDQLVAAAGGRVYLTKDIRLAPDAIPAMYPRLAEWRAARDRVDPDGVWRSDLGLRTQLIPLDA